MPRELSRVEFIKLTVGTRERFDAWARRKQFPWPSDVSGVDRFDPSFALLTIVQDELNDHLGMPLNDAARLGFHLRNPLFNKEGAADLWSAIYTSACDLRAGKKGFTHVLAGGINGHFRSGKDERSHKDEPRYWIEMCGTFDQIAEHIRDLSGSGKPAPKNSYHVVSMALVSITRAAATLMQRAEEHGIDLNEFWNGTAEMVKAYQDAAKKRHAVIMKQLEEKKKK